MSKVYKKIKDETGEDPTTECYPGTILDFLLDRLACGLTISTICADYRLIWHSDITEDDILEIIKGHEQELPERRKQAAKMIRDSNLLTMHLDAIKDCYNCVKTSKNSKEKIYFLNTLNAYLSIYLKNADQKELDIRGEVNPESVISLLDGIMINGGSGGQNEHRRKVKRTRNKDGQFDIQEQPEGTTKTNP